MSDRKIQVGQTVYLEPIDHALRYGKDIIEAKVTKVGRKYFEVEDKRSKFDLEKMHDISCYTPQRKVYLSKQEIEDKREKRDIIQAMQKLFGIYGIVNLSLKQLREIQKIVTQDNLSSP